MDTSEPSYLNIEACRKAVTIDGEHLIQVRSSAMVSTDIERRGMDCDLSGVHLWTGPFSMTMSTQEALDIASAITEAALFYREKKADALAHYKAMARDAKAGVA